MFDFDMLQSALLIAGLIVLGEVISRWLKAAVPAIMVSGLIFVLLLWTKILPADLVTRSGLTTLAPLGMMMLIVHMGTTTNLKELLANWRIVAMAFCIFAGQLLILLFVMQTLFDRNIAIGALPGGMATALIVQEKAAQLGYDQVVVLSVLILSLQGIVACPLVSIFLKKEVKRLQKEGLSLPAQPADTESGETAREQKPQSLKEETHYPPIFRLLAAAWLASRIQILTGFPQYVMCLFLGVLGAELGLLRKNEMDGSKSQGFVFFMMMAMIMGGYAALTPQMLGSMILPLLAALACDILSIMLIGALLGPKLGISRPLSMALGMNVMVGFPMNLMISEDVIRFLVRDQEEQENMLAAVGTKMVLGGFVSTTFLSTVAAGFLVGFLQ